MILKKILSAQIRESQHKITFCYSLDTSEMKKLISANLGKRERERERERERDRQTDRQTDREGEGEGERDSEFSVARSQWREFVI